MENDDRAGGIAEEFRRLTGHPPEGIWQAPGRVNLIGEHTDYNAGLALPFAIDRCTIVAVRRRTDHLVRVWSANLGQQVEARTEDLSPKAPVDIPSWARYPLGVIWASQAHGVELPGLDISVSSTVPIGGGLSSSAALTVALAVAVDDIAQAGWSTEELAKISQEAEALFAGVPCGLLDQLSVLAARAGHAVVIDFMSQSWELVPLDAGPLVVISTGVQHANAAGAYANRRAVCEQAAAKLGLKALRQATLDQVEAQLSGEQLRRARHVVTENLRVLETVERLRKNQPFGDLLTASHISLRDDYEVSCAELDLAVETAVRSGADGARLTGAGFGGCAISIGASAQALSGAISRAFGEAGFAQPSTFDVAPSDGAGRLA
ncbi:MAG: galactokinase [Acidimicrobiales bacterium]